MNQLWYELLDRLIAREGLSRAQVGARANVSTKTITSWIRGDVLKPRRWQPLARVLQAVHAATIDVDEVLALAGHRPVAELHRHASPADQALLAAWLQSDRLFMAPDRPTETLFGRQYELVLAQNILQEDKRLALIGMGGVGKTTLAIELAHQLRHQFPDGVLWGNLRLSAAESVLESWALACGKAMDHLKDFASRAAFMRTVLANRRVLIVLDDVVDSQQATHMLPSSETDCSLIITTRSVDVANLLTRRQGQQVMTLLPLGRQASVALLASVIGQEQVAGNSTAASDIAALLGDLPLGVQVCAGLSADTGIPLPHLVQLLSDLQQRLDYLRQDETPVVRLAFEQSWQLLNETQQQSFANLAVFAGRSFTLADFAACTQLEPAEAGLLLSRLCRRSLLTAVHQAWPDQRYQQHTLLAAFALEKLPADAPIWHQYSQHYLTVAKQASQWHDQPDAPWDNVLAGMATAAKRQAWTLVKQYQAALTPVWARQGLYTLARQGLPLGLTADRALADPAGEAATLAQLGVACLEQNDLGEAQTYLQQALAIYEELADPVRCADSRELLARLLAHRTQYEAAIAHIQIAWQEYQQAEELRGLGQALYRYGMIEYQRSNYEPALHFALDAIRAQHQVDDALGIFRSHILATTTLIQLQQFEQALHHGEQAAALIQQIDNRVEHSVFCYTYADLLRSQKKFAQAHEYATMALALFRDMADSRSEANALLMLAGNELFWNEAEPARQAFTAAFSYCEAGLAKCEQADYQLGKAFLLMMQGRLEAQNCQQEKACATLAQAFRLSVDLNHHWLQQRIGEIRNDLVCG